MEQNSRTGRHWVVGAGGIGCVIAVGLHQAGHPVTLVETSSAKRTAGKTDGVQLSGHGTFPIPIVAFVDWNPSLEDQVWLCTKCYDNRTVLARVPESMLTIPVQNGYETTLEARPHQYEGIASFVAECERDRLVVRITRPGELYFGSRFGGKLRWQNLWPNPSPVRGIQVKIVPDIRAIKNTKLMYNAAISPLAAAAGLDNGELLSQPVAQRLFFALLQENYQIFRNAGSPLAQVGPLPPRMVAFILGQRWLARRLARRFEPSLRGTYCSMAGEFSTGQTELPNYTGHLLKLTT
ncbi:MAG: ketopantoate reductase family protein, partial [Gemmataceae bacterium]